MDKESIVYDLATGASFDFVLEFGMNLTAGPTHWCHVCTRCVDKYGFANGKGLEEINSASFPVKGGPKNPPCSVEGCYNESKFFYDFTATDCFLIAAVRRVTKNDGMVSADQA